MLGDDTRRRIFFLTMQSKEGITAAAAAEASGVHRTVARMHLEKLVQNDVLERRSVRTGQSGRPATMYIARNDLISPDSSANSRGRSSKRNQGPWEQLSCSLAASLEQLGEVAMNSLRESSKATGRAVPAADPKVDLSADGGSNAAEYAAHKAILPQDFIAALERTLAAQDRPCRITWRQETQTLDLALSACPYADVAKKYPGIICTSDSSYIEGLTTELATKFGLVGRIQPGFGAKPFLAEGGTWCTWSFRLNRT